MVELAQSRNRPRNGFALTLVICALGAAPSLCVARNVVLFVADGLRPSSVNPVDAPALSALRDNGVYFSNSHAVFPTVTMANAAAIATGHQPGDTGIYSNSPWIGYASFNAGNFARPTGSPTPFIENDQVLADLADHYAGNPLGERTLLSLARGAGFATASVGKLGPAGLQDVTQLAPQDGRFRTPQGTLIDDATGPDGVPLPAALQAALREARLPLIAPARIQLQGDQHTPGTGNANWGQQVYFIDATTRALLPALKTGGKPFLLVYWSRDPDGTQHNQGDSFNSLWPGINGDTSALAVRNADHNLQLLLDWLNADPDLAADTDVIVTSDHGFATISKRPVNERLLPTASLSTHGVYADVPPGFLPPGFLAIDLARQLGKPLYDPDMLSRDARGNPLYASIDPAIQHPSQGSGLIGGSGKVEGGGDAELIVTANGGSDSIYLPIDNPQLVQQIVACLGRLDYVGALFVQDRYGDLPGTLPMSAVNLVGSGKLPAPAIVVAFRSFALSAEQTSGTADPLRRVIQISDTPLQQGQGMHGGIGRESTFNFMAAIGPDFRMGAVDAMPAGNADLAPTIAALLGLRISEHGALRGRVLGEALRTSVAPAVPTQRCVLMSEPASDGRRTVLEYQQLGALRYVDRAEFRQSRPGERAGCVAAGLHRGR